MLIELESLSLSELDALIVAARKRKQVLDNRPSLAIIRKRLARLAARMGYDLG